MTATTGRGLIQNPILCSPFVEPDRHFEFTTDGIQNNVVQGRRPSCYFIPIPEPKKGPRRKSALRASAERVLDRWKRPAALDRTEDP